MIDQRHDQLVKRMAKLRQFIAAGHNFLRQEPEANERTAQIAQAILAAQREHDALRREAISVRPVDWLPG